MGSIAGGEIELLIETRIVRDMHFAVASGDASVTFEHHGGVVVDPFGPFLEQGSDQHNAIATGHLPPKGDVLVKGLGVLEKTDILTLAKIFTLVELLQNDKLSASLGCGCDLLHGGIAGRVRDGSDGLLDKGGFHGGSVAGFGLYFSV